MTNQSSAEKLVSLTSAVAGHNSENQATVSNKAKVHSINISVGGGTAAAAAASGRPSSNSGTNRAPSDQ